MERAASGGGGGAADAGSRPKVVVFDLDGCVWYPEMYMLWGGGAPFTTQANGDLKDNAGQKCYLMGAVRDIMASLKTDSAWAGTQVAVASSCDEPSWARECLTKFTVGDGIPLSDIVAPNLIEIYKASSKQVHLKAISKASGVPLSEMMFLDNERGNCNMVAKLGVTVIYTPDGVTAADWENALRVWPQPGKVVRV